MDAVPGEAPIDPSGLKIKSVLAALREADEGRYAALIALQQRYVFRHWAELRWAELRRLSVHL